MCCTARNNVAMLPLILVIVFFTRQLDAGTSSCHNGCNCFNAFVTCSDLKSLKEISLPLDTATLVLSNMQLESIPRNAFVGLRALTVLELQNNTIRSVAEGAFSGLCNMNSVMIVLNTIDIINRRAFSDMFNVTQLTFSRNVIGSVKQDAFSNLTNIKEITFQSNNFTSIRRHAFHHLTSTKSFQFYLNRVRGTVEADSFSDIDHFQIVSIYLNHFRTLECRTLDNLVLSAQKISIYSNKFKCHCKLAWMLSQTSMTRYLSSNWCTTNRLSKPLILSTVTIENLHCLSENPSSKQHGCPNSKTKVSFITSSTSSKKEMSTVPPIKHTTQRKHGTFTIKQTTYTSSLPSSTMSTVIETDRDDDKVNTSVTSGNPRISSYASISKMNTLESITKLSSYINITSTEKLSISSTPKTASFMNITNIGTSTSVSTSSYTSITNTGTLTSPTVKTTSYISITNINTTIASTPKTVSFTNTTNISTLESPSYKTSYTNITTEDISLISPMSNISSTKHIKHTEGHLTSTSETYSVSPTGAMKVNTSTASQISKTPLVSTTKTTTPLTPLSSKTSSGITRHRQTFYNSSTTTYIRTLGQQTRTSTSSLPSSSQTATVTNVISIETNQPNLSPTIRAASNTQTSINHHFGKHDLSTKSVKISYRHTVSENAGHVISLENGSLLIVLYLTLTATIC